MLPGGEGHDGGLPHCLHITGRAARSADDVPVEGRTLEQRARTQESGRSPCLSTPEVGLLPGTGEDPSSTTIPLNTPNASSSSGLSAVHRVASSFQGEAPYAFITGSRRVQFWKSKSFTT